MANRNHIKMNPEGSSGLWSIADRLRGRLEIPRLDTVLRAALEQGMHPTWQDIYDTSLRYAPEYWVTPPYVADFLSACLADKKPKSIFDPWAGIGSLLLPIVNGLSIPRAAALTQMSPALEIARGMDARGLVQWTLGSAKDHLDDCGEFDVIVSWPPLGLRPISEKLVTGNGPVPVKDSEGHVVALKCLEHLAKGGEAFFILPNNFFAPGKADSAWNALSKLGFHVNSVIALPAGTVGPHTTLELNIVQVSKTATSELFVGALDSNQDISALVANLKRRREGPAPELGRLLRPEEFRGWNALIAQEEEVRLAKRSGLMAVRLRDLVTDINLADRRKDETEAFSDIPNSVYLPLIGNSPAVSALSDLRIKPHNYAQLVVSTDRAYAGFLAEFFNSPLGRKTREKLLGGAFIPKISRQNLLGATVYTLPLEGQQKATAVTRSIRELRLSLEQLESTLWRRPVDAGTVERALAKLNEKEGFESWLETIPFPLASILWRYKATVDVRSKNEHLLHFFEAAAVFLATLMTSAFHSDRQFFDEHKREWFDAGKDRAYSLTKSSFGQWIRRCYALAKTTRTLLNGKDTRDLCLRLFKTNDLEKLTQLANRALYSTLEKAGGYRNLQAHGGVTSEQNELRKLALLEKELTETRALLGALFEDWWLVRAGASTYTKGVHHYTVEKLSGSRQVFTQEKVQTTTAMDSEELYLYDTITQQPLQLLHFFRMMPSPQKAQIACYFYSRVEKERVEWVSYHFEEDDDVVLPDPSVVKLIQEVEELA